MTTAPLLPAEATGLVFEAGGRRLIDGIDLRLEAGTRTVVLGPNGAGKTVLLRLLHGLLAPTAGSVRWGGRPPETKLDFLERLQAGGGSVYEDSPDVTTHAKLAIVDDDFVVIGSTRPLPLSFGLIS